MPGVVESVNVYINGLSCSHALLLYSDFKVIYRYVAAGIVSRAVWSIEGLTADSYTHSSRPIPTPTTRCTVAPKRNQQISQSAFQRLLKRLTYFSSALPTGLFVFIAILHTPQAARKDTRAPWVRDTCSWSDH